MKTADRQSMTLRFLRPTQIDGCGNAKTSQIPVGDGSVRRLPGGLATGDVLRILPRLVLYHTDHRPRSLPERGVFVTGDGGLDAQADTRGPVRLVTDRAVFKHALRGLELLTRGGPQWSFTRVFTDKDEIELAFR